MALTTTAFVPYDIYGHTGDMALTNKLFCSFVEEQQIDGFIEDIKNYYTIAYNKVFVLYDLLCLNDIKIIIKWMMLKALQVALPNIRKPSSPLPPLPKR